MFLLFSFPCHSILHICVHMTFTAIYRNHQRGTNFDRKFHIHYAALRLAAGKRMNTIFFSQFLSLFPTLFFYLVNGSRKPVTQISMRENHRHLILFKRLIYMAHRRHEYYSSATNPRFFQNRDYRTQSSATHIPIPHVSYSHLIFRALCKNGARKVTWLETVCAFFRLRGFYWHEETKLRMNDHGIKKT